MENLERKEKGLVNIITFFGNFEAKDILYHVTSLDYLINSFTAIVTLLIQFFSKRVTLLRTPKRQKPRESIKIITFLTHLNYEKITNLSDIYIWIENLKRKKKNDC
jgi:hypothetical protein